jgi:hypothetical protein
MVDQSDDSPTITPENVVPLQDVTTVDNDIETVDIETEADDD